MDYSRFYTPPHIAQILLENIVNITPKTIIDICCGSCNLLNAARSRWKHTELFGVDIVKHSLPNVRFVQMDGRKFASEQTNKFDLVLANPPFDYVTKKREFPKLYSGVFSDFLTNRLEIEMLIANLQLLNEDGILMIILPNTFVESDKNKNIRTILGHHYHIKSIIKLPDDTFGSSCIRSYALVIRYSKSKHHITKLFSLLHENSSYYFSEKEIIPQINIRNGYWSPKQLQPMNIKLNLRRGNISSQSFTITGEPVLHTSKNSQDWAPSVRYYRNNDASTLIYAEKGDIIVSRIGRSAGRWHQHSGERIALSDCLYCLKDPDGEIIKNIAGKNYSFPVKGVTTRYITIDDFTRWYFSLIL